MAECCDCYCCCLWLLELLPHFLLRDASILSVSWNSKTVCKYGLEQPI